MAKPCIFCAIAAGAEPAEVIFADASCVAFLDTRPVFPGHVLLIPREHFATLIDLPDELLAPLFGRARALAECMESALGADGSFVAMNNKVSQSVAHLHVHVIPRRKKDGLRGFFWPRQTYADASEAAALATRLRAQLQARG
jgi:histidine triad (HIT) family protein